MMWSKKVGVVLTDFILVYIDVEPIEQKKNFILEEKFREPKVAVSLINLCYSCDKLTSNLLDCSG